MSIFEHIRKSLITLLRAERVEFDPAPTAIARGLIGRRLPRVEIRATGVPVEHTEVVIDQLDVVAENVRLHLALRPSISVGRATFKARLTQQQLSELVPLPLGVDRLSVTPKGFTFHTIAGIPIYTSVKLENNKISVAPSAPAKVPLLDLIGIDIDMPQLPVGNGLEQLTRFGLTFSLPRLPGNAQITDYTLHDGYVVIAGVLDLAAQPQKV